MPNRGSRILIVEDDYFIASELGRGFEEAGLEIVGPVASLQMALAALEREQFNGAVLDVNLDGDKVYEVADLLIDRGIPVVFVTGYERSDIPGRYRTVPLCLKPVQTSAVIQALGRVVGG